MRRTRRQRWKRGVRAAAVEEWARAVSVCLFCGGVQMLVLSAGGGGAVFLCAGRGGRGGSVTGNESRATGNACRSGNKGRRLLMGKLPCF